MDKPKVVYHGSQYKFDVLMPRQANGQCEVESKMGVYAASTMEEVIPFALPFFDEGVFGNYGWDKPLGASGLVVWDKDGSILWEADNDICDCYAMNIDNSEKLWYYFYTEFELVCTDLQKEKNISGSCMFILTADGQSVIFDKGYDDHDLFVKERLIGDRLSAHEDILLDYDGGEISPWRCTSRGSLAAFIDSEYRLFVKNFISV